MDADRNAPIAWTTPARDMSPSQWRRAMADQGWRLNNLYYILDKRGRRVQFRMNWAQQEFFQRIWFNDLVLKARQFGFSTLIDLIGLDTCLHTPDTRFGIIAHDRESAEELMWRNIRYPYDQLPERMRQELRITKDAASQIRFSNGSQIRVATSLRSATLQLLHISEFGKICAKAPDKAREIVTGTLETVGLGQWRVIESTAEGAEGYFHDYCQTALALRDEGRKLTMQDWRLHFFGWWRHPDYEMDPEGVLISPQLHRYFRELEHEIGRKINPRQRAWYAKKYEVLGEDMWREYPSTEAEAFKASIQGTYYHHQIAVARQQGRVGHFPALPRLPTYTFWDLGMDDYTAVWVMQWDGQRRRFIGYYESCGEPLQHYVSWLHEQFRDRHIVFAGHYLPHDAARRRGLNASSAADVNITIADVAENLGLVPLTLVSANNPESGIQAVRDVFPECVFDAEGCDQGLKRLAQYRKEWNERTGAWHNRPRHDDNSHGADAFREMAVAWLPPSHRPTGEAARVRRRKRRSAMTA